MGYNYTQLTVNFIKEEKKVKASEAEEHHHRRITSCVNVIIALTNIHTYNIYEGVYFFVYIY